ncbi:hypothetical protein T492DRAFT_1116278 [Pavlovales sp. CCMP2436]|nr:hypothetical protein T492DRAFT_1116278 [Pavlovales sp. CCMP2436]
MRTNGECSFQPSPTFTMLHQYPSSSNGCLEIVTPSLDRLRLGFEDGECSMRRQVRVEPSVLPPREQEERQRHAGQVRRTHAHLYKVTKNEQTQVMVHTPSNKFISATKWHQIFYDAATDVAERKDPMLALHMGWFVTYLNRFHARASNLHFAQIPAPDITPSVLPPLETDEDMSVASLLADEHAPAEALVAQDPAAVNLSPSLAIRA